MLNFACRMKKHVFILGALVLAVLMVASCSAERRQMRKYLVRGTMAQKDSAAFYFYNNGDYEKAIFLFEELMGPKRGTPEYENLIYHYAWAKFKQKYYVVAAHYFEQYTKQFANSERAVECAYQHAYCFYLQSDPYYLDQTFTRKAIDQFQVFLVTHPESERTEKANQIINDLRERLAKKSFEQANLYYKVENYKASVTAFRVMMQEFPDSRYQEEAHAMLFRSMVGLADISTQRRKENRYLDAIDTYEQFVDRYPTSVFTRDLESLYAKAKKSLGRLRAEEAEQS